MCLISSGSLRASLGGFYLLIQSDILAIPRHLYMFTCQRKIFLKVLVAGIIWQRCEGHSTLCRTRLSVDYYMYILRGSLWLVTICDCYQQLQTRPVWCRNRCRCRCLQIPARLSRWQLTSYRIVVSSPNYSLNFYCTLLQNISAHFHVFSFEFSKWSHPFLTYSLIKEYGHGRSIHVCFQTAHTVLYALWRLDVQNQALSPFCC